MSRGARKIILWSVILVASAALFAYCFVSRFRLPEMCIRDRDWETLTAEALEGVRNKTVIG